MSSIVTCPASDQAMLDRALADHIGPNCESADRPAIRHVSRREWVRVAAVTLTGLAIAPHAFAQATPSAPEPKNKALFSVTENDPARWRLILGNLYNIKTGVGDEGVELEVVAYGPGLNMLKADSPVKDMIAEAVKAGVKVSACQNTMRAMKLTNEDILPGVTYVPAGVVEVMRKQQQGWSYIRS